MIDSTILNRYRIESELGKGGMGVVYKAHDTLLNRDVAIKFLSTSNTNEERKMRLLKEARAAAKLNHPNIVAVYDAGEVDGVPFIVMELVKGDTLRKRENPDFSDTIRMAQQICLALDHAHANGIIHRDLKLENIVITNTQILKLMDFGLAHTLSEEHLTQEGALMGTLAYIAPELIQGGPASPQSDLYAFGIILYELFVGREPFQGNMGAVLGGHLYGQVIPPSKFSDAIPDWVDELVLGLLSKNPEERPVSARAVSDILVQQITPAVTAVYKHSAKPRHNLPTQNTSFIGREKEIKEVTDALSTNRLVTLTGSGGSGKTRISIQTAANVLERFSDGVWFVELASLTDQDFIPQTILTTLGVSEQAGKPPLDILKTFLQERQALIVLDNCEHLIEASAKITDALLSAAPELNILASSREALGVRGEFAYPVPSLSQPDIKHLPNIEQLTQYESVRLFVDRATLVAPHFRVDKDNASFIAQVCSRLDGIPLALELAAARVKVLSIDQIAKRLDDRFRLLTDGARTVLPRQQTLRATIDWSYHLLTEKEKTLFRRLAIFSDGWTLEAIEDVCSDDQIIRNEVLELLEHLFSKSVVNIKKSHPKLRYEMLETIREYASEKLVEFQESDIIHEKHLVYYLNLAKKVNSDSILPNELEKTYLFLDEEYENLRQALVWSLENESAIPSLDLCNALYRFWEVRGYWLEGLNWMSKALSKPYNNENASEKYARSRAKYNKSGLEWQINILEQTAYRLIQLGNIYYLQGNLEMFKQNFREGISLKKQLSESQKMELLMNTLVSLRSQKPESLVQLLALIIHLRKDYSELFPTQKYYLDLIEMQAREHLGDTAFNLALAEGQAMNLDEALALVLKIVEEI